MTQKLAAIVYWFATVWMLALPVMAGLSLVAFERFQGLAMNTIGLPIRWQSVAPWQWYSLWVATLVYLCVGYLGVIYLRRAFASFAQGQWFDAENSRNLRMFSLLLIMQAIAKPLHQGVMSVLLSWNHPPGEKMLSIALGSNELALFVGGLVMWVMSDLLVAGMRADAENKQFV
ncbi:MAG: hypothetical protein AAGI24_14540 [Pseudomonadota bacterium]